MLLHYRIFLLLIVSLFFFLSSKAQIADGQIYYADDTVSVALKVPLDVVGDINFIKLQKKVKYYDSTGRKVILRPSDVKEVRFTYASENIRMISVKNNLDLGGVFAMDSHIFLKLEIDGNLKLLKYHYTQTSEGMHYGDTGVWRVNTTYEMEKYIFQKGNGRLFKPLRISFKNDMVTYFKDCPELAKKIDEKHFRMADMDQIVRYYNTKCK